MRLWRPVIVIVVMIVLVIVVGTIVVGMAETVVMARMRVRLAAIRRVAGSVCGRVAWRVS
jgi:hypothetical protein